MKVECNFRVAGDQDSHYYTERCDHATEGLKNVLDVIDVPLVDILGAWEAILFRVKRAASFVMLVDSGQHEVLQLNKLIISYLVDY